MAQWTMAQWTMVPDKKGLIYQIREVALTGRAGGGIIYFEVKIMYNTSYAYNVIRACAIILAFVILVKILSMIIAYIPQPLNIF